MQTCAQSSSAPPRRFTTGCTSPTGAAGAAGAGLALLGDRPPALAQNATSSGSLTKGDAAMLRFAAAAEILEADFWIQYNELGGIQDDEVPGGSGNPVYNQERRFPCSRL